jgi:hypothetical protein
LGVTYQLIVPALAVPESVATPVPQIGFGAYEALVIDGLGFTVIVTGTLAEAQLKLSACA